MHKIIKPLKWTAWILVVVGALNWGAVALGFDLVELIFGAWPMMVTAVYGLVGVAAVVLIILKVTKNMGKMKSKK